jgi:hypothetical protein
VALGPRFRGDERAECFRNRAEVVSPSSAVRGSGDFDAREDDLRVRTGPRFPAEIKALFPGLNAAGAAVARSRLAMWNPAPGPFVG